MLNLNRELWDAHIDKLKRSSGEPHAHAAAEPRRTRARRAVGVGVSWSFIGCWAGFCHSAQPPHKGETLAAITAPANPQLPTTLSRFIPRQGVMGRSLRATISGGRACLGEHRKSAHSSFSVHCSKFCAALLHLRPKLSARKENSGEQASGTAVRQACLLG